MYLDKSEQNRPKLSKFPDLRLRLEYVVLRRILRVITGCLRGFYGVSTGYGFFTGCLRVITRFLNPPVNPVLNVAWCISNLSHCSPASCSYRPKVSKNLIVLGKQVRLPRIRDGKGTVAPYVRQEVRHPGILPHVTPWLELVVMKWIEIGRPLRETLLAFFLELRQDPQNSKSEPVGVVPHLALKMDWGIGSVSF